MRQTSRGQSETEVPRHHKRDLGQRVALSAANAEKWLTLLSRTTWLDQPKRATSEYEHQGSLCQQQVRLSASQVSEMAKRYQEGATVYELAKDFRVNRETASLRLRAAGVAMRRQPITAQVVDQMVDLYATGLSAVVIAQRLDVAAQTVLNQLHRRGVQVRGPHERMCNAKHGAAIPISSYLETVLP